MRKDRRLLELAGVLHRNQNLLKEEEGDEEGEDLFGGGDDEGGDEEGDAEGDEEEGEGEGEEEEEEEEEEPEAVAVTAEDEALLGPAEIDRELDGVFATAFDKAMKSAVVRTDSPSYPGETPEEDNKVEESLKNRSLTWLLKEEADDDVVMT